MLLQRGKAGEQERDARLVNFRPPFPSAHAVAHCTRQSPYAVSVDPQIKAANAVRPPLHDHPQRDHFPSTATSNGSERHKLGRRRSQQHGYNYCTRSRCTRSVQSGAGGNRWRTETAAKDWPSSSATGSDLDLDQVEYVTLLYLRCCRRETRRSEARMCGDLGGGWAGKKLTMRLPLLLSFARAENDGAQYMSCFHTERRHAC